MAKTIEYEILPKQIDSVIKKALQDKKKIQIFNNGVEIPVSDDFTQIKKEFTSKKLTEFEVKIRTVTFNSPTNGKNATPSKVEEYTIFNEHSLKGLNAVSQPQPQQNENLAKYYSLLEESKSTIQKESDWKLEKFAFEQKIDRLQEKCDNYKDKNTELIAQCAKLEGISDKFEVAAKEMEGKANFTDVVKGLAGNLGNIMPILMGGGSPTTQMMGIEQGQQVEQQNPEIGYNITLSNTFGELSTKVDEIVRLFTEYPKMIGDVRDWMDRNKSDKKYNKQQTF